MHPENPYRHPPDFKDLARDYPSLKPHLKPVDTSGSITNLDFKDPEAQRRLTEALLHRDFGLQVAFSDDRLCPPVPNRLNYVLWIRDLIRASILRNDMKTNLEIIGFDIGTGASAIYPLLACSLQRHWKFVATEIDDKSFQYASANVENNPSVASRIKVIKVSDEDPILRPLYSYVLDGLEYFLNGCEFAFTMCNPPFYESAEELLKSAERKAEEPNAVCTGADVEMITPGGEVNFVKRIIEESSQESIASRCVWFTSMLGKLSSVSDVVQVLRTKNVDNYAVTELIQGQTRRWAVAWSYGDYRLPDSISRQVSSMSLRSSLPMPNCLRREFLHCTSESLEECLLDILGSVEGVSYRHNEKFQNESDEFEGFASAGQPKLAIEVIAMRNSWSRAARRKANTISPDVIKQSNAKSDSKPALECTIRLSEVHPSIDGSVEQLDVQVVSFVVVECEWTRGRERSLFESFWGHISRRIVENLYRDDLGSTGNKTEGPMRKRRKLKDRS